MMNKQYTSYNTAFTSAATARPMFGELFAANRLARFVACGYSATKTATASISDSQKRFSHSGRFSFSAFKKEIAKRFHI